MPMLSTTRGKARLLLGQYEAAIVGLTNPCTFTMIGTAFSPSQQGLSQACPGRYQEAIADFDLAMVTKPITSRHSTTAEKLGKAEGNRKGRGGLSSSTENQIRLPPGKAEP